MKAIMAMKLSAGSYQIHPEAEPEDWAEVSTDAVTLEYLGPVEGCTSFRHAVRVVDESRCEHVYLLDDVSFGSGSPPWGVAK
jgi:hypothetical protein